MPGEILERTANRERVVVLTAPWHERDTRSLVERLGARVFTPPPDTADDLVQKYGITPEQAAGGSPDLAWLLAGDSANASETHRYTAGEELPSGIEAVLGREHNDLVFWIEDVHAVIPGDTMVDFGRGFEVNEWLRGGVTREEVVERLRPLLDRPVVRAPDARSTDGPRCPRSRALLTVPARDAPAALFVLEQPPRGAHRQLLDRIVADHAHYSPSHAGSAVTTPCRRRLPPAPQWAGQWAG